MYIQLKLVPNRDTAVGISSKTNLKINIFGTLPVTRANVNKKKNCYYFF